MNIVSSSALDEAGSAFCHLPLLATAHSLRIPTCSAAPRPDGVSRRVVLRYLGHSYLCAGGARRSHSKHKGRRSRACFSTFYVGGRKTQRNQAAMGTEFQVLQRRRSESAISSVILEEEEQKKFHYQIFFSSNYIEKNN